MLKCKSEPMKIAARRTRVHLAEGAGKLLRYQFTFDRYHPLTVARPIPPHRFSPPFSPAFPSFFFHFSLFSYFLPLGRIRVLKENKTLLEIFLTRGSIPRRMVRPSEGISFGYSSENPGCAVFPAAASTSPRVSKRADELPHVVSDMILMSLWNTVKLHRKAHADRILRSM